MGDDESRLLDILLACREAREFVAGVAHGDYLEDRMLQSALCMKLEIIGEASRIVSDEFKQAHAEIPWVQIVGLRHRIVHEHFRLDLDIIWETVQRDIPVLIRQLEPLVPPPEET